MRQQDVQKLPHAQDRKETIQSQSNCRRGDPCPLPVLPYRLRNHASVAYRSAAIS